ncbi:AAA family ATPase [Mollicutes bacterium LVI A0039]|nr:AAA family ATPase [Mollicutes bacterium LVI A0039]
MKIISIYNHKGGVGKTTATKFLASYLESKQKKVLLIDMDPQSNLSKAFINEYNPYLKNNLNIYDVLMNDESINSCKHDVSDYIHIVPSSDKHNDTNNEMLVSSVLKNPSTRLKNKLIDLDYDYVIIDCAPTKDLLATASLTASDEVLVPLSMDKYAIDGIRGVVSKVEEVKREFNSSLKISGIFLNAGKTSKTYTELHEHLLQELPTLVLSNKVNNYMQVNVDTFNSTITDSEAKEQFYKVFEEVKYGI